MVETVLARCLAEIRRASRPERSAEQASLACQTDRYERYQQVLVLRAQRLSSKEIARQLGMKERTIRRLPPPRRHFPSSQALSQKKKQV